MKLLSIAILIFSFDAGAALKGEDSRRTTPADQHENHHMGSTVRVKDGNTGAFFGSGILVEAPNVLLTNWHVLHHRSSGKLRSAMPVVQLSPALNTQPIAFDWSNYWCDEDLDVCVIELEQKVPEAGAVGVIKGVPEAYIDDPSKFGAITVSGFSLEMFNPNIGDDGDIYSSTEATSIVPAGTFAKTKIKKVESCRLRDFDELFNDFLGDCDSRKGNSGSGVTVPLNGIPALIGYVHNQIVLDIEDEDPYNPKNNAVAIRPITEDISVEIQRVYERSKQ